jgi:hypothetical protein
MDSGVESGSDYRSRDTGSRNHRLAKSYRRIDLDQPGLVLRSLHDEWVELEETLGIAFDAFQVKFHHSGNQYLLVFRKIHDVPEMLDEQVPAIGLESLLYKRMFVLNVLGKGGKGFAHLGNAHIVDGSHAAQHVAFQQITERQSRPFRADQLDQRRNGASAFEPIGKSVLRHPEVLRGLRDSVDRSLHHSVSCRFHRTSAGFSIEQTPKRVIPAESPRTLLNRQTNRNPSLLEGSG